MISQIFIWECILLGISEIVNAGSYYFATENLVRQNFEYTWKVFVLSNVDGLESNSVSSENITMLNEKLLNASWIFELENDRHGILLYATYSRPTPFYTCNQEYDIWINPWDLILGNVSVSTGNSTTWLPRMTALSTDRDRDEANQYELESTSRGCRKIRKNVLIWTSLRNELDNLIEEIVLSGSLGIFLEIKFNFLFLSQKDNTELIQKYNEPFSSKKSLDFKI